MELVTVRVRDCACPGTPHADGDEVYILPKLTLAGGLEAQRENNKALVEALGQVIGTDPTDAHYAELQDPESQLAEQTGILMSELLVERWMPVFIRHGAVGWNLVNEAGPLPFSTDALLEDFDLGKPVADAAADLYAQTLMRPLLERLDRLSPPSPQGPSPKATRRRRSSTPKRRSSSSAPATDGAPSANL